MNSLSNKSPIINSTNLTNEISSVKNRGYNPKNVQLLLNWATKLGIYILLHQESATYYRRYSQWISYPSIILSPLLGIQNFTAYGEKYLKYVAGFLNITLGIVSSFQRLYRYSENAEAHTAISKVYEQLHRYISTELSLEESSRVDADHLIDHARSELDKALQIAPAFPEKILLKFKEDNPAEYDILYSHINLVANTKENRFSLMSMLSPRKISNDMYRNSFATSRFLNDNNTMYSSKKNLKLYDEIKVRCKTSENFGTIMEDLETDSTSNYNIKKIYTDLDDNNQVNLITPETNSASTTTTPAKKASSEIAREQNVKSVKIIIPSRKSLEEHYDSINPGFTTRETNLRVQIPDQSTDNNTPG